MFHAMHAAMRIAPERPHWPRATPRDQSNLDGVGGVGISFVGVPPPIDLLPHHL